MPDFIVFMHDDTGGVVLAAWAPYLAGLGRGGRLQRGSAVGGGGCFRRAVPPAGISAHITGLIRITAENLAEARTCLDGNPVFEAGGTVEIRALPADD
jgi:hypothetical protein